MFWTMWGWLNEKKRKTKIKTDGYTVFWRSRSLKSRQPLENVEWNTKYMIWCDIMYEVPCALMYHFSVSRRFVRYGKVRFGSVLFVCSVRLLDTHIFSSPCSFIFFPLYNVRNYVREWDLNTYRWCVCVKEREWNEKFVVFFFQMWMWMVKQKIALSVSWIELSSCQWTRSPNDPEKLSIFIVTCIYTRKHHIAHIKSHETLRSCISFGNGKYQLSLFDPPYMYILHFHTIY